MNDWLVPYLIIIIIAIMIDSVVMFLNYTNSTLQYKVQYYEYIWLIQSH
jgi:hypothetical protein